MNTFTSISPEEMRRRKMVKRGLDLSIMVCGVRGTGKSSFINTLCGQQVIEPSSETPADNNVSFKTYKAEITEINSTPINLEIVTTPRFGDKINNEESSLEVLKYLEAQYDTILDEECRVERNTKAKDKRIHVVFYLIRPTGKPLRELDLEFMKMVGTRANVIPLLSKADLLTEEELQLNKQLVMDDIKDHNIPIYDFTLSYDSVADSDYYNEGLEIQKMLPFAVIGGNNVEIINGQKFHTRDYPWGTVRVEDPDHCDFLPLRNILFGSYLQDFKDSTHSVLYEKYRTERLAGTKAKDLTFKSDALFGSVKRESASQHIDISVT
ncbi:hypothetical protein LJB42_002892 [Komagataella kurtzmanii]|nr:hypothetical protein LJB42_002892 [Komagataella kurtzmanii]